jgi:hypothetical protein
MLHLDSQEMSRLNPNSTHSATPPPPLKFQRGLNTYIFSALAASKYILHSVYLVGILASAALYIHTCYTYIVFCIGGQSSLYTEAYCSTGRKLDAYVRTVDSLRSQQSTTTTEIQGPNACGHSRLVRGAPQSVACYSTNAQARF